MATQQQPKYWTYADLLDLPEDGKRYEIIDGVLYEMPSANSTHAVIIMNLIVKVLSPVVFALGGQLLTAPLDVFLRGGNPVQPDLIVLLPEQLGMISDRGIEGAPALLVEVLSPSNSRHDLVTKRALYARARVQEYWIVSPEAMSIEILTLDGDVYRTRARLACDEPITSALFPTIATPTSVIFDR